MTELLCRSAEHGLEHAQHVEQRVEQRRRCGEVTRLGRRVLRDDVGALDLALREQRHERKWLERCRQRAFDVRELAAIAVAPGELACTRRVIAHASEASYEARDVLREPVAAIRADGGNRRVDEGSRSRREGRARRARSRAADAACPR